MDLRWPRASLLVLLVLARLERGAPEIDDGEDAHRILLRAGIVDTRSASPITTHLRLSSKRAGARPATTASADAAGALQLLVRVHDSVCTKDALEALLMPLGGRVLNHVSRCAFTVLAAGPDEAVALADASGIVWVGPMLPHYKIAPELLAAGQCPLRVQLEPPLCRHPRVQDARDDCALTQPAVEWAARQAARWLVEMNFVNAEAESATCVIVGCAAGDMARVASALASQALVGWVDRYMPIKKRNYHAAYNMRESELKVDLAAVWARGINGSGEVVHVADSGVDAGHCLFRDEGREVPFNKVDTAHRKIVAYWTGRTGDRYDAIEGHGTHVAGSIAGSLEEGSSGANPNPARRYQGIAPGAKLAVTDAEVQTPSDGEGIIILKDIVQEVYSKPASEAGAQVQSHSWGTQQYSYTQQAADVDSFLHKNREALFVWAAGNDAASKPMQTIGSPATAKNCLTVGATFAGLDASAKVRRERHPALALNQRQLEDEPELFSNEHVQHFSGRGPCTDGRIKPDVVLPGLVQSARSNGRLANSNCCLHPSCSFATQCAKDCSGQGQCVETASGSVCRCRAGYCGNDCSIKTDAAAPAACCPSLPGANLPCASADRGRCEDSKEGIPATHTFSACVCGSDFGGVSCEQSRLADLMTTAKWGTSMAAPLAAGMLALIRQYFRSGFYPSGIRNVHDGLMPSGALLKAALLTAAVAPRNGRVVQMYQSVELAASDPANSLVAQVTSDCAREVKGDADKRFCSAINASMSAFPNPVQGFGRPLPERVLYFSSPAPSAAYPASSFNLFISDDLSASNASVHSFCFYYEEGEAASGPGHASHTDKQLVATLTWMDPPASPAALTALVNDLDLEVQDTCHHVTAGNEASARAAAADAGAGPAAARRHGAPEGSGAMGAGQAGSKAKHWGPTRRKQGRYGPHARAAEEAGGRVRDGVNNVERVVLSDGGLACAAQGRSVWVRVRSHYVPEGPQPFALVVRSRARPCGESRDLLQTLMSSVYLVVDVAVAVDLAGRSKQELRGLWASALRLPTPLLHVRFFFRLSVSRCFDASHSGLRPCGLLPCCLAFAHCLSPAPPVLPPSSPPLS